MLPPCCGVQRLQLNAQHAERTVMPPDCSSRPGLHCHCRAPCPAEPFHFTDHADQMPVIQFREYSFLSNERTPQALKVGYPGAAAAAAGRHAAAQLCRWPVAGMHRGF